MNRYTAGNRAQLWAPGLVRRRCAPVGIGERPPLGRLLPRRRHRPHPRAGAPAQAQPAVLYRLGHARGDDADEQLWLSPLRRLVTQRRRRARLRRSWTIGWKTVGSTPTGITPDAPAAPASRGRCRRRAARHRDDAAQSPGDPALHAHEAVPPEQRPPPGRAVRGAQVDPAAHGHRVVDRGHQRPAEPLDRQQAVAEGLVVVDDVELAGPPPHQPGRPQAERQKLREPAGP
jgi:hypothetical protein